MALPLVLHKWQVQLTSAPGKVKSHKRVLPCASFCSRPRVVLLGNSDETRSVASDSPTTAKCIPPAFKISLKSGLTISGIESACCGGIFTVRHSSYLMYKSFTFALDVSLNRPPFPRLLPFLRTVVRAYDLLDAGR